MITIEEVNQRLLQLDTETKPEFGFMSPQHMLEHLCLTLKISYGRIKIPEFTPSEKQLEMKRILLETNISFPKGVQAPGLVNTLLDLKYENLEVAKEELIEALIKYKEYYLANPSSKTTHPRFGLLNFSEWEIFHSKHFEHHFGQFGI